MIHADPKTLQRMRPSLQRVLVIDTHPAAAKLLVVLLKDFGATEVMVASTDTLAWSAAHELGPQLIFVELRGPGVNGAAFTHDLRRSNLAWREAPVVMMGAEPTVQDIRAARDAGAHEFLRKPFTTKDLFQRVENVSLRPRPWIEAKMYVGPDRRRFNSAEYRGPRKRRADAGAADARACLKGVAAAIRAQLASFAKQPQASLREMLQQSAELQNVLSACHNPELAVAVSYLERYMLDALERARLSPKAVERHLEALEAIAYNERLQPGARQHLLRELETLAA